MLLVTLPLLVIKVPLSLATIRAVGTQQARLTVAAVGLDIVLVLGFLAGTPASDRSLLTVVAFIPVLSAGLRSGVRAALAAWVTVNAGLVLIARHQLAGVSRPDDRTSVVMGVAAFAFVAALAAAMSGLQTEVMRRNLEALELVHDDLQRQAMHDSLTGLANRNALYHRAPAMGGPGALLAVDLDGFKLVNDAHGHAAGDTVLRAVADRMTALAGPDAFVVRMGGDEFVLLLSGADAEVAASVGALIEKATSQPVDTANGQVAVGASIGIALVVDDSPWDIDQLCAQADAGMYRVKRARTRSNQQSTQPLPLGI